VLEDSPYIIHAVVFLSTTIPGLPVIVAILVGGHPNGKNLGQHLGSGHYIPRPTAAERFLSLTVPMSFFALSSLGLPLWFLDISQS